MCVMLQVMSVSFKHNSLNISVIGLVCNVKLLLKSTCMSWYNIQMYGVICVLYLSAMCNFLRWKDTLTGEATLLFLVCLCNSIGMLKLYPSTGVWTDVSVLMWLFPIVEEGKEENGRIVLVWLAVVKNIFLMQVFLYSGNNTSYCNQREMFWAIACPSIKLLFYHLIIILMVL